MKYESLDRVLQRPVSKYSIIISNKRLFKWVLQSALESNFGICAFWSSRRPSTCKKVLGVWRGTA